MVVTACRRAIPTEANLIKSSISRSSGEGRDRDRIGGGQSINTLQTPRSHDLKRLEAYPTVRTHPRGSCIASCMLNRRSILYIIYSYLSTLAYRPASTWVFSRRHIHRRKRYQAQPRSAGPSTHGPPIIKAKRTEEGNNPILCQKEATKRVSV